MTLQEPATFYARQGDITDPKEYRAWFDSLPKEVGALCRVIQGLLIHDHYGLRLYGPPPPDFQLAPRETLAVSRRVEAILAAREAPISSPRQPFERSLGTCRDFALMLCAMLRQFAVPARVRCGFARYLDPHFCEDHWICEYWKTDEKRWAIADAQLDATHRKHLSIDFDPADLPKDRFVFPWQAWQLYRSDSADPELFRHGDDAGAWFIQVNLARDLLSLLKREVSVWDGWRDARTAHRTLDDAAVLQCDRIASLTEAAKGLSPPELGDPALQGFLSRPPWQGPWRSSKALGDPASSSS